MIAYHGKPELKQLLLDELRWHRKQDMLAKGTYGEGASNGDFQGCAVGCAIHSLNRRLGHDWPTNEHQVITNEFGVPLQLVHLLDGIFENLPDGESLEWPTQFFEAIEPGADLSLVWPRLACFILSDCRPHADQQGLSAIDAVIGLYSRTIAGGSVPVEEWAAAEAAAAVAAGAAAYAAAYSAAYAARDAVRDARDAAWAAAWAAAYAARAAAYRRFRDELLRLLRECPVLQPVEGR